MHMRALRVAALLAAKLEHLDLSGDLSLINQEITSIEKIPGCELHPGLTPNRVLTYYIGFTTGNPPDLPRQADQLHGAIRFRPIGHSRRTARVDNGTSPDVSQFQNTHGRWDRS